MSEEKKPVAKVKKTTAKKSAAKPTATKTKVRAKAATPRAKSVTAKPKAAAKPRKPRTAAVAKAKTAPKAKIQSKPKVKKKEKSVQATFTDAQKLEILAWVGKIDMLHKHDKNGLKTLAKIDEILDKYNQRFKEMNAKFEAIIKYGIEKDPRAEHEHFYVALENRDKDANELYEVLAKIGHGEMKYDEAKQKMMSIYKEAASQKFVR